MAIPTLEGLPTELRIVILRNITDLSTLRSLIHGSMIYQETFHSAREAILENIIYHQYGHMGLAQAIAAVQSKGMHASEASHKPGIATILNRCRHFRSGCSSRTLRATVSITAEECVKLLDLHEEFVFFLQDFCLTAPCPPWMDAVKWRSEMLPVRLSDVEAARILRALCRLETFCNIFGVMDREVELKPEGKQQASWIGHTYDWAEVWDIFFGTMPPWEVEEIFCVRAYLRRKYAGIFAEIANDVSRHIPGPHVYECQLHLEHMADMGPNFLYRVLHEPHKRRRDMVERNIDSAAWSIFELMIFMIEPWGPGSLATKHCGYGIPVSSLPHVERPNLKYIRYRGRGGSVDATHLDELFRHPGMGDYDGWNWYSLIWDDERLLKLKAPL
ncbi:conserved hypothetical protein [Coccidioides posadasii str. Silveira]|uniref:Uncharacterized protein n=3 Tax=Coccidioides posadasii TaxID=199306 RepID=E9DJY9_COCPS|nr:conserved hypothetical protein [Coccidioides posadasii str. Silveira]KMM70174.1 hypothetical protein CPAG_06486 [Coccidioides posadasii RMSCC 3488]